MIFTLLLTAVACSMQQRPASPVPGEESVSYDGPRDPLDVAVLFAVFRIERDHIIGERPYLANFVLVEADEVNGAESELGSKRGICDSPNRCVIESAENLSDTAAAHEITHAWDWQQWQTNHNPDSEIPLSEEGDCIPDGCGSCSHTGGGGSWTVLDDDVIGATCDMLRSMGF